jgi:two-component system, OmpR family, sensor kinase
MTAARLRASRRPSSEAPAQDARRRGLSLRRIPFRVRLTLGFAAIMIVLFGGLALLLDATFEASLDQSINRSLSTHAGDLASLLRGRRAFPGLPESGGAFAQIVDPATGGVLAATPGYEKSLLGRNELRHAARASMFIDEQGKARLLAGRVATQPPAVLVVGSSLSQRNGALTALRELLFIGGPALLVLTCLVGYGLAAGALAPVKTMSAQAARISGGPPGERLPVPEANDELHQLGETLNAMLSRLEDALARERAFVGDAGHELRTPLAILKLELEFALASDTTREELEARLRSVAEEVDRLDKLAQDLLVIARAEQGRLPLEKRLIGLRQLLGRVATRFAPAAGGKGRVIKLEGTDELAIEADPTRLEQALTNMVSNALVHADGPIVLLTRQAAGKVEIHVLDDGPGFEPQLLPHAFERFARADRSRSERGAGLGLSIVEVIAEAHGGRARARNREAGGADVWLELPGGAGLDAGGPSAEGSFGRTARL